MMQRPTGLFGLPAAAWVAVSAALIAAAALAPHPGASSNPADGIFREPVLAARTGEGPDGWRLVGFGEHVGLGPLYAFTLETTNRTQVARAFGWANGAPVLNPGFFRRWEAWSYRLKASRFDGADKVPPSEIWLPDDEVAALRPRVIAELNRRSGAAREGDRLASLLDAGASGESPWCWQNVLVFLAWSSVPPAIGSVVRARRFAAGEKPAAKARELLA